MLVMCFLVYKIIVTCLLDLSHNNCLSCDSSYCEYEGVIMICDISLGGVLVVVLCFRMSQVLLSNYNICV